MKRFLLILLILLCSAVAFGRGKYQGIAGQSAAVITSGTSSSTKAVRTFPSCTVTVYVANSLTLASIYSDNAGTVKANPFTAGSDASYFFYADSGRYDIRFSGTGITTPFTLGDVIVLDSEAGTLAINPKVYPYNAVGDGKARTDCSITNGSATLVCTGGQFVTGDAGKKIVVYDAGPLNAGYRQPLSTMISARSSATTVTLAVTASATVSNSPRVLYGTDDTAALQAALDALAASDGNGGNVGGVLDIPAGIYLTHGLILPTSIIGATCYGTSTKSYNGISIRGAGRFATTLENWDTSLDATAWPNGSTPIALIDLGRWANSAYVGTTLGGCYAGNKSLNGIKIYDLGLRQPPAASYELHCITANAADHVEIYNTYCTNRAREGFTTGVGYFWKIHDNFIEDTALGGPSFAGNTSAYNITNYYAEAYDNYATNVGQGFECGGHHQHIHDNHVVGVSASAYGFNIGSTVAGIWEVDVSNNVIEGFSTAIFAANVNGMLSNVRIVGNTIRNGGVQFGAGKFYNAIVDEWDETSTGREKGQNVFSNNTLIFDGNFVGTPTISIGTTTDVAYPGSTYEVNNNTITFATSSSPIIRLQGMSHGNPWVPSTAYTASITYLQQPDFVIPIIRNGYVYRCTTSGTSGTTEPSWPLTIGNTVSDGTAVWTNYGVVPHMELNGLHVAGPSNFSDASANLISFGSGSRRDVHVSNVVANFRWYMQAGSFGIDAEQFPPAFPGDPTYYVPADAIYSDNNTWFDSGTNGSGLSQTLPWAGYWKIGTKLWRTHPASGAAGLGLVVTRSGYAARTWGTARAYTAYGQMVLPTVDNGHVYYNIAGSCTTHATTEPTWPTGSGSTVSDNTCTWKEGGASSLFVSFP